MSEQRVSRKAQAERRREQLLDVTLELFVERGIENVSIADLAARAGVAHGLVYHYFESKEELIVAVMRHAGPSDEMLSIAEHMRGLPLEDGLRLLLTDLARLLEARGEVLRFLLRETLSPRSVLPSALIVVQEELLGTLSPYLLDRVDAGELRPHDPRVPFRMLISSALLLGIMKQPIEPWIDSFIDTILTGIRVEKKR